MDRLAIIELQRWGFSWSPRWEGNKLYVSTEQKRHSENKIIRFLETRLDLECSTLMFKHASRKNSKQQGQNREIVGSLCFTFLVFPQRSCLSNVELEHFRFDLICRQPKLHNNVIFGMLHLRKPCVVYLLCAPAV